MQILYFLAVPLIIMTGTFGIKNIRVLGRLNALGYFAILACTFSLAFNFKEPFALFNFFYVDALSMLFLFTISVVSFAASLFSVEYIAKDVQSGIISEKKARGYYLLFNLFSLSMFFVPVVNSLGMVWVGIELTTLASAFLVGFNNNKTSLEAAWKYIIICSVGIILALFGTIIFYYTASTHAGVRSLNWTDIAACAKNLNINTVKVAFLFIIVGYGTKAGLAPMHTWLPDAHSQAISPASAMLSGVLLKTALYAILRFSVITNICVGAQYSKKLFILFGLFSLAVACGFLLVQKHIKRFLAYSSIEHIGIIVLGFGLGSSLALYGAFLHIFNHAVTKSLMFFGAANVVKRYKKDNMHSIRGVISAMPFTGFMLVLGMFAIAGMPPFSIFFSELFIAIGGFLKGSYLVTGLYLFFIVIIFGAIIYHLSRILFGKKPQEMVVVGEALSTKLSFIFLIIFICTVGIKVPEFLNVLIVAATKIVSNG
ncbi:MAG: hydrogenase 4 subunit F [Candidatus Omnitrophota bacterium]|jgi:hydrogenase-4 component F